MACFIYACSRGLYPGFFSGPTDNSSSADLRRRLYAVTSFDEIEGIFGDYLRDRDRGMFAEGVDSDMEIEAAVA